MTRLEKFHLSAALLGVLVNLFTLFLWADSEKSEATSIGSWSIGILTFLLFYAWFSISWILVSRVRRAKLIKGVQDRFDREELDGAIISTILGVGVLILPVWLMLWSPFVPPIGPGSGFVLFGILGPYVILAVGIRVALNLLIPIIQND